MASHTASFGKRAAVAAAPVRAPARKLRGDDQPDSRPASVIASQNERDAPRPVPIAPPGFIARIVTRIPWFTLVLSYVLICRFNAETAAATDWDAPGAPGRFTLLAMGGVDRLQVVQHGEWWRLFTATALHGSSSHLWGNLTAFLVVGILLEPMIGIGWFALIYFTGGFAGAMLSIMLNPAGLLSVGASGAIMAMVAAMFVLSFHTGARRPGLMRWRALATMIPALAPSVHGGIDVNAHLGGALAGAAMGFIMLIVWPEHEDHPPGRSIAAIVAGLWIAATVYAFSLSHGTYRHYAADGIDTIRPADMPHGLQAIRDNSYALVEKYPRDPRSHLYRGVYFIDRDDVSDAEPYFRSALALNDKNHIMGAADVDWARALLAMDVHFLGRHDEAKIIAEPLCGRSDLDNRAQIALNAAKLCQ